MLARNEVELQKGFNLGLCWYKNIARILRNGDMSCTSGPVSFRLKECRRTARGSASHLWHNSELTMIMTGAIKSVKVHPSLYLYKYKKTASICSSEFHDATTISTGLFGWSIGSY